MEELNRRIEAEISMAIADGYTDARSLRGAALRAIEEAGYELRKKVVHHDLGTEEGRRAHCEEEFLHRPDLTERERKDIEDFITGRAANLFFRCSAPGAGP